MPDPVVPLSPEWWVARLYKQLTARQGEIDFYDAYYRGDHPMPWIGTQARDEFRRMMRLTRTNYMGLVVDSMVERMHVEGFRVDPDTEEADRDAWRIWQANNMDSDFGKALKEAAICGQSYLQVAPNEADPSTPHMWVEHASQAIVEYAPGTTRRVRAASLKVWDDDWVGSIHATLQLPDRIYKYRADRTTSGPARPVWSERFVAGEQPNGQRPNPLGVVSMVELPNNPRLLTGGVSELADLTDIQDSVNETKFCRHQTQRYGADPQKWATGFPQEDVDGTPTTIEIGRNRVVTTEVVETRFGQWNSAPLDPYSGAKREDVKDIASRSRTPAQYLLGEMVNVNGETLKASESGLVSKIYDRRRPYGEAAEEAQRLVRRAAGLSDVGRSMETIWRNPEFRTEGELTDSVVKKYQSGIATRRQARVDVGYSESTIRRLEAEDRAEALDPLTERLLNDPDEPDEE